MTDPEPEPTTHQRYHMRADATSLDDVVADPCDCAIGRDHYGSPR
jgi:hypothetical protein